MTGDSGSRSRRSPARWYAGLSTSRRLALWGAFAAWAVLGVIAFGRIQDAVRPDPGVDRERRRGDLLLVAVRSDDQTPVALAMLHAGHTRNIVLLASGTMVEVPGLGPRSLRAALTEAGRDGLGVSVANALEIGVPDIVEAGPDQVAALVRALGAVDVDVPETIRVIADGFETTLYRRGRQTMDPQRFTEFMTLVLDGENELERVARQQSAWRALLDALAREDVLATTAAPLHDWAGVAGSDAARVIGLVAADRGRTFHTVPVQRVGIRQEDLYRVQAAELDPIWDALSDARPPRRAGPRRVRLLLSPGLDTRVAVAATARIVEDGWQVKLTGRAAEAREESIVVMADSSEAVRAAAGRLAVLMDAGRPAMETRATSLFDVTLVIGTRWADRNGLGEG